MPFVLVILSEHNICKVIIVTIFPCSILLIHCVFTCMQEVIGKSVKQAVCLPLYTVPGRYDTMSVFKIHII